MQQADDTGLPAGGVLREMQQLVQAALHAPAPAAPAAARSHPQLLVVQHEGSRVGTPTAEAAAAAAAEASGYDSPGAGGAAAGQGEGFSVPVAVRVAAPVPERAPVGPKLVFYGKPACHLCGERGHAAHSCSTPFCQRCDMYGHAPADCADACERCGRVHSRSDGVCRTFQCAACDLFGRKAGHCPSQQCSACGMLGHSDRHCQAHRHCAMLSSGTVSAPQLGAGSAAADIAVAQLSSSSRQQEWGVEQGQLHSAALPRYPLWSADAAAANDEQLPSHSQHEQQQLQWQPDQQQQQQPRHPRQALQLQAIQQHLQAELDSAALPPCQLPDAAAAHFEASLPEGLLPADWQACASWQQLDRALSFASSGMPASQLRRQYRQAKAELQRLCAAAQEAEGVEQQQQHQQQQQPGLAAAGASSHRSVWGDTGDVVETDDSKAAAEAVRPSWAAVAAAPQAAAAAAAAPPAATATMQPLAAAEGLTPGSAAWAAALQALLSRQGCAGKAADVKWRVIMPDGDRLGPFSAADMQAWLLTGRAPKGLSKQQAAAVAEDPESLQLCGILASDYSAQRLPGAKFYRPLGQLLPAVAGGLVYAAVGKADIAKGVPAKDWNCSPPAAAAPAVSAAAAPPAVQASSKAWRSQEQQQQPQQQRHRLSRASGPAAAASPPLSFLAAATRDRSAGLAAAEEAQLAAAIAQSEQQAAAERLAEQWGQPSWLLDQEQQQQQQPAITYAAALARRPAAEAAAAEAAAEAPASAWQQGVSSSQQGGPGSSPWGSPLPVAAALGDNSSAGFTAGMNDRVNAASGLAAAAEAAASVPGSWGVVDSPFPASGVSGMPAAALPYTGQQQPWQGCNAAAAGQYVPAAASSAVLLSQHQQQLGMPGHSAAPSLVVSHSLLPEYGGAAAAAGAAPAGFRMPPGFDQGAVHGLSPGIVGAEAAYGAGMPPGWGGGAVGSLPAGFQGAQAAAIAQPGLAAVPAGTDAVFAPSGHAAGNDVVAQPGVWGPAVGSSNVADDDDELQELLGLLGV
uniref:CCHC-type domain-containing protein n=1 Tax=Tetradesmus obliquus TaxID=3088 RepID=A0A383V3E9_TETOB|eukprot:jgi/Sobl393_1/330/SZX60118.1